MASVKALRDGEEQGLECLGVSGSQGNSHGGNQIEQGGCRWNREVVGIILDF